MGNIAQRIEPYVVLGYIKKFTVLSVGRFISKSIKGKICITLCDLTPIAQQTKKLIGNPVEMHPYIVKFHICQVFKLVTNKFKETGCCEQPVCNACIRRSRHVHICSTCGLMKCNTCPFIRYYFCGNCDDKRIRKKEFCIGCWMKIRENKGYICGGCGKYPTTAG